MKTKPLSQHGGLVRPRIILAHRRLTTSISLEPVLWEALQEIAAEQDKTVHQLVAEIDQTRTGTLSASIRVFIVEYYRGALRAVRQAAGSR